LNHYRTYTLTLFHYFTFSLNTKSLASP